MIFITQGVPGIDPPTPHENDGGLYEDQPQSEFKCPTIKIENASGDLIFSVFHTL